MKKIAVFISDTGSGTNLQAIIDAIKEKKLNAQIAVVVSDTSKAKGINRARKNKLPVKIVTKQTPLIKMLKEQYSIEFICLCGWKKIIPKNFIDAFPNQILNLHPGLIPDTMDSVIKNPDGTNGLWNKGKLTEVAIQTFIDNGASYTGSSVHFLTHEFDFGPVLGRAFEKIQKADTVAALYQRLKKKENKLYVEVLKKLCNDDNS